MQPQLFRIDDRLIHGQVVVGWARNLKSNRIILCDDDVACNDWERELYLSCVVQTVETLVMNTEETSRYLADESHDVRKTIVLVKSPDVVEELIGFGYTPVSVNLGGIHFADNRKEFLPYLFLNDDEIKCLRSLESRGVEIYCQDVPTSKKYNLTEILLL